ncbi:Methylmalonyl-CoA mutase [Mucinivorans hirudinis]|uniref:Methylmalonyl-CoA mutase n=1 Tax=Mucinivorans hirudinis TaxID=1433126 RepID=A0A060R660_9BACT|nr:Methylmalonyl-CoA mutase [Mucinivorans hirudinis]
MAEKKQLMAEFPPVSTQKWKEVITADLKGADYEKKLVWKTLEGFAVEPFYRAEDLAGLKHIGGKAGEFPYVNGAKMRNDWFVRQTIKVDCPKEANKQALDVLMRGVDSIGFVVGDKEFSKADLDVLLNGIELKAVEVAFSGCGVKNVATLFIENYAAEGVRATFDIDPLKKATKKGGYCKGCGESCNCFNKLVELIKAKGESKIRIVGVGGVLFNAAGANAVQELAFSLAMGHEYLAALIGMGLSVDQAACSMKFTMAISSNYFMEIAKFRAARMLWANIVKQYNPQTSCASKMRVHTVTSEWNMTVYDPYVNMLRGTTEAMSAAIAGVDSIEVLPFDHCFESPTEFSTRIARNAQLLLKEESHLDQVVDPSAGSYYIETLTAKIAEAAWELFKKVEDKGGYCASLQEGFIQDIIKATSDARDKSIATRRETLLGTNQYPNFNEVADKAVTAQDVTRCTGQGTCGCGGTETAFKPLRTYRGAMEFEALRFKTDKAAKEPKAFMLTCGALAFARARAQFSCNFFACAGIRVQDNTYFNSVAQGAAAALEAKAEIVVVCAADDDYATLAVEAYNLLKGKAIVVVAGAPACRAELEAAGIKHFISVKDNVLETLKAYQTELGI